MCVVCFFTSVLHCALQAGAPHSRSSAISCLLVLVPPTVVESVFCLCVSSPLAPLVYYVPPRQNSPFHRPHGAPVSLTNTHFLRSFVDTTRAPEMVDTRGNQPRFDSSTLFPPLSDDPRARFPLVCVAGAPDHSLDEGASGPF